MSKQIDFPELEGKVLDHFRGSDKDALKRKIKVVNCHREIGITLVLADDKKHKLYCLNAKKSNPEFYDKQFDWIIGCIKKGEMFRNDDPNPMEHTGTTGVLLQVSCAF